MTATYDSIATTTLSSAANSITFSSIPATFTDLRVILTNITISTSGASYFTQFNSDTASNYSWTLLKGNGSAAESLRGTSQTSIFTGAYDTGGSTTNPAFVTLDIFSYAGSTNKTVLGTYQDDRNGSGEILRFVGLWRSTSAINAIKLYPGSYNFNTGTTATLYGIKAE